MKQLLEYRNKFTFNSYCEGSSYERRHIKQPILDLANQQNLFDSSIDFVCTEVEKWFEGVEILKFTEINEQSLPIILKFLKLNKKKLDLSYYQKIMNKGKEEPQLKINFFTENELTKFEVETKQLI